MKFFTNRVSVFLREFLSPSFPAYGIVPVQQVLALWDLASTAGERGSGDPQECCPTLQVRRRGPGRRQSVIGNPFERKLFPRIQLLLSQEY